MLALHAMMVADAIVVPSHSMVDPIEMVRRRLRFLPDSPVHVVSHGRPAWQAPDQRPLQVPMRLFLPGIASWTKNIPFMARVLEANRTGGGPALHLTITATGSEVIDGSHLATAFADVMDSVSFIGVRPRDELPHLYAEHDVVVFPSLVESFGHPPLEAMTMGMPVVASDRSWAREVCKDGALYADPKDPGEWVDALRRIHNSGRRENDAGQMRALAFDWDRAAEDYAELLLAT
ncbi:MAG: glycosyltransferase [Actinomycetota bacterium]